METTASLTSSDSNLSFFRQRVAITGKLLSMPRSQTIEILRKAGAILATGVSRRTNVLIVGMGGWPLLPTGEISIALRRAEELNRCGASIRIISEEEFLEGAGRKVRGPTLEKSYSAEEICTLTGVTLEKLRRWEQLGLIRSAGGCFDFQDLISLRTLTELIEVGVRPEVINSSLHGLSRVLPGTQRPLAQLQIVMENSKSLIAELDGCKITAEGQFMLDFDGDPLAGPGLEWKCQPETAEAWMQRGRHLEENEELDQAAAAYRKALALNPSDPEPFFNLGNVARLQNRLDAALELFLLAASLSPSLCEAWYNIADIQEEQDRLPEAIESLKQSIIACPTFADAYYNLALCFEKIGRRQEARPLWTEYLRLDPSSEWAEVARRHLTKR